MAVSSRRRYWIGFFVVSLAVQQGFLRGTVRADVTGAEVERALELGVKFLRDAQQADGSWPDGAHVHTGTTSLAVLALLSAGAKIDSLPIQRALAFLRGVGPANLNSTYALALQTMVFAAAEPDRDRARIVANAEWLMRTQHNDPGRDRWLGNWTYADGFPQPGDNSNSQYALLGLSAASEAGVPVKPEVWDLARRYFENFQNRDGGWGYTPGNRGSTASMTSGGIASLIICGSRPSQSSEALDGETIHQCGEGEFDPHLNRAINWLARNFYVHKNLGHGPQYKHYYLYALERAGRLAGLRYFGQNDWYRLGAQELVRKQSKAGGFSEGFGEPDPELVATSFAVLFLAKGRAPVLINKLSHLPDDDWNKDADDVRNIVSVVSHDWKNLLTWQVVDTKTATVEDLLQAPIAFFNGHQAPVFPASEKAKLREFVDRGGFIFAEACCGSPEFDRGFKHLMKEIFPEEDYSLRPLASDHPVWRAKHLLAPDVHPLWGIEHGCRTVVIYSPKDLSCYWNQWRRNPTNPSVDKALKIGQNVVDYATGREMPHDKLSIRVAHASKPEMPKRGALRIAKLRHAGEWNIAPNAIPNLMEALRRPPLSFDVVVSEKVLFPRDPGLVYYPLVYVHGRSALHFEKEDLQALAHHLEPGGGTLFADAACGSADFDTSFRRFVAELLPNHPLVPIPHDDDLFTSKVGFDLKEVEFTRTAGGHRGYPELEGVKLDDHWAIIYSKFDIGCALERKTELPCKGYTHSSAVKIAANVVIYATLP